MLPAPYVAEDSLQKVLGHDMLTDEVWLEDAEFVALHNLGWRVVEVIMRLVIFVPLEARVHAVEEARFSRPVLVGPQIGPAAQWHLHAELCLILPSHSRQRCLWPGAAGATLAGAEGPLKAPADACPAGGSL